MSVCAHACSDAQEKESSRWFGKPMTELTLMLDDLKNTMAEESGLP